MQKTLTTLLILLSTSLLFGQSTVSTFHAISLYWSPAGGSVDKQVLIQYSVAGANEWKPGFSMKYQPIANCGINPETGLRYDKADYRGSIVDLTPNMTYDIQMTLEGTSTTTTIQATTWSETFPIGQTISVDDMTTTYHVPSSGTANGYLLIDGTGSTIDIQDGSSQCIELDGKSYVILRGFTLKNAGSNGIRLFDKCHHIVIEDCDISGWGEEDVAGTGFGKGYQAGVYAGSDDAAQVVIQRNKIHHPRWDTNSWAELHDPSDGNSYHPSGPQGISLGQCNIGNNVIRYNEIWSDDTHYFNDILGMWSNASYSGFPGPDSDIYGNYLANCWDDGIESEGSNANVRIFANYIENNLIPIANAATSIGPLFIWKNVSGRNYSLPGSIYGEYGPFLKLGYADGIEWMTGQTYVFNNTVLQPNNEGSGGMGTSDNSNRHIKHCMTRNNIFHVQSATTNAISTLATNEDIDFDYDLMNKGYPAGHEANGISNASPIYNAPAPTIDYTTKIGDFRLASNSPGYDAGQIISNFTDTYNGAGPDMGAHEAGTTPMVFGVGADYPLPLHPLPIDLLTFDGENSRDIHRLTWVTTSEVNASHFEVEHSVGGTTWQSIGRIEAKNNTADQHFYAAKYKPTTESNYYRLKLVDLDGSFRYSNILFLKGFTANITLSPNPTNHQIQLSNVHEKATVTIFDNSSQIVLREVYNGRFIDVAHLPKGAYYLKVNDNAMQRFILE